MSETIGGSVESCSIDGREFDCVADADVQLTIGGFANEVSVFGSGNPYMKKTRMPGAIEGLQVGINHEREDLQFLQDVADSKAFVVVRVTLASGDKYQGKLQITEAPKVGAQASTAELAFMGGKLSRQ